MTKFIRQHRRTIVISAVVAVVCSGASAWVEIYDCRHRHSHVSHEEAVREAGRQMSVEIETRDAFGSVIKNPTKADLIVANRALRTQVAELRAENKRLGKQLSVDAPFGSSAQMWPADGAK